ncbi:hypothetical protein Tco_1412797 [Tanacetum coccineum]
MASMNTRLNIEKLDENIVQKHRGSKQVGLKQLGSKQVGFKQLGPGVETGFHGVQDEKRWLKDGWRTSNLKRRQTRTAWVCLAKVTVAETEDEAVNRDEDSDYKKRLLLQAT